MRRLTDWLMKGLASGLYLSYLPALYRKNTNWTGAGIIGTLWGVALSPWLPLDSHRQIAVWLGAIAIAVVACDWAEDAMGKKDDPRIIIDEMIGYWTALLFLPRSPTILILAFVLFRLFDVYKPGPIRRIGEIHGGWGIVADDVLAGFAANAILHVLRLFHPL